MVFAHIAPLLESLLFAPAFIAVGWALLSAWRSAPPRREQRHD